MQKQKLPTYSKKDAAAVASSTEKQGAAAARGGGEPTSFFMSLLHRAGKPRSLTMNEFDLPENYGIVDRSFRTKAMAHSKFVGGGSHNNSNNNNKIRSSSSSNALSQKGGPEQPTLPLLLVSTVETRFHSTVYEEEKEQPSSVRRVGGGLPSVASDADTRLPSPIGSSAATAAAAGSVECCASPLPSEGPPPPAETATHHTVAASSNVQSLPPSQCADLSLLTVAGLNESLDRNGLMFGSPSAHKLLHDSWNVTSAHSDGSEGVGSASTPPLPISSKTRLALCGGIRAGSPRKRVAPLLPLTELNVALHRPEPRDARTGLSLLWQLREVLTHDWIAQLDLDPTANLSDDEGMTDLLCSASFRAHAADAASRQHQQQQRSRSPHGSFVRVNSLRGASTDLSAADNDGGVGAAIETVTSQPFDAERIPPIRNPFEGVPPTDPMASLVQTLHAAPFHWLDLTNAGFSPSTKIAANKSNNEDGGGGASEAHPLPASRQGASTTLAEALFNTSTTSSAAAATIIAAPSVPVVENENNMNSNPLVVPEPSSYQLAKLHLPSTALESIQHKERLRRAALLGHTNPFHSTGDDAGGGGGDNDQPLLLEQQPNARKISSNGIIQVKYGSGANSQESGIQRSTNSLLATPSALPSWASSLLATIPVASGGGSNSATPWNTLFQYFLNTMASSGSAADRCVAFQRLCDLQRAFCSYCGTYVASHFFETIGPNIQFEAAGVFFSLVTVEADGEEFACNNKPSPAAAQADASGRSPTHLNRTLSHNTFDEGTSNSGKYDEESSTDGEGNNNSVARGEHGAPAGGGSGSDPPVHSICAAQRKICGHETRWISHLSEMWWKDLAAHQDAFRRSSYATMDQVTLLAPLAPPTAIATKIDPSLSRSVLFPLFCSVNIYGHTVACTAVISAASNVSMATPVQTSLRSTSLVRRAALEGGLSPYFLSADDHPETFPLKKFDIVDSSVGVQYGCCPTATASGKSQCQNPHCICRYVLSGVTAFPPLIPTLQYCPLVRLRPQFTRTLTDMLPADTFSANLTFAEKQNAQSMAVKVTRRLMHKTIAELVHSFELSWSSPKLRDPQSLANLLQHRGVNMCFLGYLGDSLFTKLRSFQAVKNSGMIPTDDGGVDEYGLTIDHHMDGLRKALASVKEEMAVRAFRVHWNDALRKQADLFLAQHASSSSSGSNSGGEPCRTRTGKQWLEDSIAMTTSMVKAFLGVESDTRTATMWVSVILPYIRSYFHFRAPMSRKDVEISSVVRRLQHLCGIVMTPASPADAVNKSALHRHETILSLTLRTARACALGNVVELRPYVKSPSPPQLPPLASLNDVGLPRTKNALMEVHRSRSGQGLTPFLHHLESRLAEVLFFENEEQRTEAPDEVMLKRIVRYQNFFVPLLAEAVECCTDLAGMLLQGRRCPDAFRCAEDALNVASTLPYGIVNPAITVLVCIAVTAARESGNRESAVHATERAVVTVVRRLTVLVEDPLNYLRKSDGLDGPRPSIERERDILRSLVDALVDAYKAISYHTLIQPLPFHDTVVSIQMLQLMCVIVERDLAKGASPRDVGAVVARAADLAEVLLCRTTEASQSCVVEALKQNLKTLVPSNE